jgi:hypothetical protein
MEVRLDRAAARAIISSGSRRPDKVGCRRVPELIRKLTDARLPPRAD